MGATGLVQEQVKLRTKYGYLKVTAEQKEISSLVQRDNLLMVYGYH